MSHPIKCVTPPSCNHYIHRLNFRPLASSNPVPQSFPLGSLASSWFILSILPWTSCISIEGQTKHGNSGISHKGPFLALGKAWLMDSKQWVSGSLGNFIATASVPQTQIWSNCATCATSTRCTQTYCNLLSPNKLREKNYKGCGEAHKTNLELNGRPTACLLWTGPWVQFLVPQKNMVLFSCLWF